MKTFSFIAGLLLSLQVFCQSQSTYVNLSVPSNFNSPTFSGGWSLVFNDEFNNSIKPIWNYWYCWGNTHPEWPFYNFQEHVTPVLKYVRLESDYRNEEIPTVPAWPENYVEREFACGMINSNICNQKDTFPIADHTWKYGYFEARIRTPKAQLMSPAFWLFGEPNSRSEWNELDIFELATGDGLVETIISRRPTDVDPFLIQKYVYSLPGQTFGNTFVTYGFKWEPNKVIWYINNKPVRIETDQTDSRIIIPDVAMRVLLTNQVYELYSQNSWYLEKVFPNYMDVDYLRIYQRSDYSLPDPVFLINGSYSFTPSSPVIIPFSPGKKIYIDASQSYMPNHQYFLSIRRCDNLGNVYLNEPEAMAWLTSQEVAQIDRFDIHSFSSAHGLTMMSGSYYKVRVAGNPWTVVDQYIYTSTCQNSVLFSTNGIQNSVFPAAINISYNNGKPRVICDASKIVSCDNNISLSVARCYSNGNLIPYTERTLLLNINDVNLDNLSGFDVETFYNHAGMQFLVGSYYRIKWSAGYPNVLSEKSQIVYFSACNTVVSFKINEDIAIFPSVINIAPGEDILLDASGSKFCNNQYFISVQNCDANGTVINGSPEFASTKNLIDSYDYINHCYYYAIGRINLREFARKENFNLSCGNYYRVKIASPSPWIEVVKVIYIQPCTVSDMNNEFLVNNNISSSQFYDQSFLEDISIYSPSAVSCNQLYFLSVQQIDNGVLIGNEAMAWLSIQDNYYLKNLGAFDLDKFVKNPDHDANTIDGFTFQAGATYKVKFVSSAGDCNANTWDENIKYISFGANKNSNEILASEFSTDAEFLSEIELFPNPASESFSVIVPECFLPSKIAIYSSDGREVKVSCLSEVVSSFELGDFLSGTYFVNIVTSQKSFSKKLIIIK